MKDKANAWNVLNRRIEKHPVLKYQIGSVRRIIDSYVDERVRNTEKVTGLTIMAPSGAGKTFIVVEFVVPFLREMDVLGTAEIYKLSFRGLSKLENKRINVIASVKEHGLDSVLYELGKLPKDCTIIVDELRAVTENEIAIWNELRVNIPLMERGLPVYIAGYHSLRRIRDESWFSEIFSSAFALEFEAPDTEDLMVMFGEYARIRDIKVEENAIPLIQQYFYNKQQNQRMAKKLNTVLDKSDRIRHSFVYAREIEQFLAAMPDDSSPKQVIGESDVRDNHLFTDVNREYAELREKIRAHFGARRR